jgi:hypothetical protein
MDKKVSMNNNTQLPAEVTSHIEKEAEEYKKRPHYNDRSPLSVSPQIYLKKGYIAGATEYANKLHQAREYLNNLISMYHSGQIPARNYIDEITKHLNGTK